MTVLLMPEDLFQFLYTPCPLHPFKIKLVTLVASVARLVVDAWIKGVVMLIHSVTNSVSKPN